MHATRDVYLQLNRVHLQKARKNSSIKVLPVSIKIRPPSITDFISSCASQAASMKVLKEDDLKTVEREITKFLLKLVFRHRELYLLFHIPQKPRCIKSKLVFIQKNAVSKPEMTCNFPPSRVSFVSDHSLHSHRHCLSVSLSQSWKLAPAADCDLPARRRRFCCRARQPPLAEQRGPLSGGIAAKI